MEQISNADEHYHYRICDDDNFDLCQACVDRGIHCHDEDHLMVKRLVENGEPIETTEQIGPKIHRSPSRPEAVTETLKTWSFRLLIQVSSLSSIIREIFADFRLADDQGSESIDISDKDDEQQYSDNESENEEQ
jgi:hypothetical protein